MVYIVIMKMAANGSVCANAYNSLEESKSIVYGIKAGFRSAEINVRQSHSYVITVNNLSSVLYPSKSGYFSNLTG